MPNGTVRYYALRLMPRAAGVIRASSPVSFVAPLLLTAAIAAGGFYDPGQVNRIDLYFAQANWDEILDSLFARGFEERLIGRAVINGVSYDSVGVRYKGHSSYNPSRPKNPLNVKLDFVKPEQVINGHGTLRLANVYKDPSFVREVLSYEIARKYMPAGMANFAEVRANGTLLGLYTNNEDVDRQFMRDNFCCDGNPRFKGRMLNDSVAMIGWKYLGPDSSRYLDHFELESDTGFRALVGLFDTLSNCPAATDAVLNVDQHLWMLAFDILLVNLDAPINMPQNHYLYRDASGRFNPIVWDLNENFGAFRDLIGTGQLSLAQMQQLDPFLRADDADYPIAGRFFTDSRFRREYVAHLKTLIAENITNHWYEDRALETQDRIDSLVRADPNKFYTYNDFLNNVNRTAGSGPLAIVGLTELMNARASWLMSRPELQAAAPSLADISHMPESVAPNSGVRFSVRVADADSVFLAWRQIPTGRFRRVVMYDDGLHGDGAAGDSIYAALVTVGAGDLQYYVCAENSEAAAFDPPRAEHEFYTLPVAGSIVINELMAINSSTMADPSGQYDDWIELFNSSSRTLSLDGYLLTNDTSVPTLWSFPDVSIPAGGYVIVWADNDLQQRGLHANFKLAGSSGTLMLSDPDGIRLDRITFGQQTADISLGRFPNGIGTFRPMTPTFEDENLQGIGIAEARRVASEPMFEAPQPNPFTRTTLLRYHLAGRSRVSLRVYDAAGRQSASLVDRESEPGCYAVRFSPGERAPSTGVYFARLDVRDAEGTISKECIKLIRSR